MLIHDVNEQSVFSFAFGVCRIEPENNVHVILEAFAENVVLPLIMVGNWERSEYGKHLKLQYDGNPNITLLPPIYDQVQLNSYRAHCTLYLHGHSCGGTNPSLVEAMYLGLPIAAFDCNFNRETTENKALYFKDSESLRAIVNHLSELNLPQVAADMKEVADRRYTWKRIADCYARLL